MPRFDILSASRQHIRKLVRQLDDSIMPIRCVFCGTRSYPGEGRVCGGCRADLPWIRYACERCAEPVVTELPRGVHCGACQASPPPFAATLAPLRYEFPVDAAIKALKFSRRLYYAPAFGELLIEAMQSRSLPVDALLPVPLHWRRQAFRGYNQAAEICRSVARHYSMPVLSGVVRHRATPFQSGLAARERSTNLRSAFVVKRKPGKQHILIVDDVVTSGATARHLARALLKAGAAKVSVLAVARASRINRSRPD